MNAGLLFGRRRRALLAVVVLSAVGAACSEQVDSTIGVPASLATTAPPTQAVDSTTSTSTSLAPTTTSTTTSTTSTTSTTTTTSSTTTVAPVPATTSCDTVVHIGDSTGVPLFEPSAVGGAEFTLVTRYLQVGVETVYPDNLGARSMVERVDGGPNAIDVAQAVRGNGYNGCWVIMIGTNDAANIAAGSNVNAETRLRNLMSVIGPDPVMFVDTVSQVTDSAFRNSSMLAWNQELYRVTAEYPNARVFRWYDVVRPEWFRNDGVHYTVEGSAQRAALTAQALVAAFPAVG